MPAGLVGMAGDEAADLAPNRAKARLRSEVMQQVAYNDLHRTTVNPAQPGQL